MRGSISEWIGFPHFTRRLIPVVSECSHILVLQCQAEC